MRKVVSPQEVTHLWVHRRQDEARNSGDTLYFKGDTIYSYGPHFPIARHLPNGAIAFTTDSYRQTTARHISLVRQAIPSSKRLIFVHNPCMTADRSDREIAEGKAIDLLASAAKRRSDRRRIDDQTEALGIAEEFNEYAEAIGSAERIDLEPIRGADLALLRQRIIERQAEQAAEERRKEEEAGRRLADKVEAWRNFGDANSWEIRNAPVALRLDVHRTPAYPINGQQVVETSRGARIPAEDAKRLWPVIQRCMTGERDYEVGMELGGYRLTKIRRDGSIVVGCHDIAFAEIERIARQLGLLEPSEVPA